MELTDKQKKMIDGVQWNDDQEHLDRIEGDDLVNEVSICADFIVAKVLSGMTRESYNGEEVIVPIPTSTHPLLAKLLSVSDESQEKVLNVLRHVVFSKAFAERTRFENKINSEILIVDGSLKNQWALDNIGLHLNLDDCQIIDYTSDEDANRNLNELMGLGLSQDHVREDSAIQGQDDTQSPLQVEITLRLEANPLYDPNFKSGRSVEEGVVIKTSRGATFTRCESI